MIHGFPSYDQLKKEWIANVHEGGHQLEEFTHPSKQRKIVEDAYWSKNPIKEGDYASAIESLGERRGPKILKQIGGDRQDLDAFVKDSKRYYNDLMRESMEKELGK